MNIALIRFIYSILMYSAVPCLIIRLIIKSFNFPEYRKRILERFGIFNLDSKYLLNSKKKILNNNIWIHSVSFGETIAAAPMINSLLLRYPDYIIAVTTTTPTGSSQVKKLFGDKVIHVYCPFDLPIFINNFLSKIKPKICILMETELWPNILYLANKNNIKVILANARLSEKSKNRYKLVSIYMRKLLNDLTVIIAQSSQDAERFIELGCMPDKIRIVSSIKFDIQVPQQQLEQAKILKGQFLNRKIIAAISTHYGEEDQIITAYKQALIQDPNCLLILIPRHPNRFTEVYELCSKEFKVLRRSNSVVITKDTNIWLGDSMGEMFFYLACADLVYVGGSLVNIGGHNVLEPAALSLPIVVGPELRNFAVICQQMLDNKAILKIKNSEELGLVFKEFLANPDSDKFKNLGDNAKKVFLDNQGGLVKLLDIIEEIKNEF